MQAILFSIKLRDLALGENNKFKKQEKINDLSDFTNFVIGVLNFRGKRSLFKAEKKSAEKGVLLLMQSERFCQFK